MENQPVNSNNSELTGNKSVTFEQMVQAVFSLMMILESPLTFNFKGKRQYISLTEIEVQKNHLGYKTDDMIATGNDNESYKVKHPPPIKEWRAEQTKLTTAKYALCERYYALQDDVRSIEQLRKGAENIMRDEARDAPIRRQDIEL